MSFAVVAPSTGPTSPTSAALCPAPDGVGLLSGYGAKASAAGSVPYDELLDGGGQPRTGCQAVVDWLQQQTTGQLQQLHQAAAGHFLREGITFTVYTDASNTERSIPFDLIPRIIAAREWQVLERGCTQRIRALNAFLHDIYHGQDILRAGVVPMQQVLGNEGYQPWMIGVDLPGQTYAQISGIDLVRNHEGQYYVLEDNLRTPSGVSYLIEGRRISEQVLGSVLQHQPVRPVDVYPQLLRQTLSECAFAGEDEPLIVVLTPGRFNSAYFEHAFLAREMQVPLVTGSDLYVDRGCVYLKSVAGPRRVGVIYRRVDDPFLDPLAFKPDSMLGVPGLMAAYRAGQVAIVNAPGTGIADDKSIYPYVENMIEFYLGEKPILNNVPTHQCRKPEDLAYVLAHLSELVVKETQGSGGYGMLVGPAATQEELNTFRALIEANPDQYIAQPTLSLSTCPTLVEQGIAPRHIDLRPFVLSSPEAVRVLPGGLTRVALREGSLVVNSSQGGGVKDTWVLSGDAS